MYIFGIQSLTFWGCVTFSRIFFLFASLLCSLPGALAQCEAGEVAIEFASIRIHGATNCTGAYAHRRGMWR